MELKVKSLSVALKDKSLIKDISFAFDKGQILCLVGESGSGKSLTGRAILRLLPNDFKVSGQISVAGQNPYELSNRELRNFRWEKVSMVFQDPSASLNPLLKIGEQISEALIYHGRGRSERDVKEKVLKLLSSVGIDEPERIYESYPHHLSGGLKQRATVAMALACEPDFMIADEPTTALDVTVQAKLLELFKSLSKKEGLGILFITHDMGVVYELADKVCVVYSGYTLEVAGKAEIFSRPLHPYTQGLIEASPKVLSKGKRKLPALPSGASSLTGCPFSKRCPLADSNCERNLPPLRKVSPTHQVRCFKAL